MWLSPEHVRVIPITDAHIDYAKKLADELYAAGFHAEADLGNARMNAKIRAAQKMKVPYMLVVGDQEMADGTVSVRNRDGEQMNGVAFAEFKAMLAEKVASRDAEL